MEAGDQVQIYNMMLGGRFCFEGRATVVEVLDPETNRARVRFEQDQDGGVYERFVDPNGQGVDPVRYVYGMNKGVKPTTPA